MMVLNRVAFSFNAADPLSWILLSLLVGLLFLQLWFVIGKNGLSIRRKWIRGILNLLLWLVLVGYFFQFKWADQHKQNTVLLADQHVSNSYINRLKDSLRIRQMIRANAFATSPIQAQLRNGLIDSVVLVGTGFSPDLLGQLSGPAVRWIPAYQSDQIPVIRWKALVRKGELQTIQGILQSSGKQWLRVQFGTKTLDSLELPHGSASFRLQFPVFSQGRTAVELKLNQKPVDTLRFFARKAETVSYQFLLDNPDFESKTLADWLGKKGHSVQLTSLISKDIRNTVQINRPVSPDVIITDPTNASHPLVKKAVSQGKPVLFINGTEPETDCKIINQALGTRWRVTKISIESTVSVGQGLQALPFQFRDATNQIAITGYPVAVQRTGAKVGFSLLSETFPLKLSGDTLAYDRIWTAILSELQPGFADNIQLDAPVFSGLRSVIHFNNLSNNAQKTTRIGRDTVRLDFSAINGRSAEVPYVFGQSGWLPLQDSLAVFVEPARDKTAYGNRLISDYLRARSTEMAGAKTVATADYPVKIPDWVWFLLFLGCLTALWLEPKFIGRLKKKENRQATN